jgi:hypothetical protein
MNCRSPVLEFLQQAKLELAQYLDCTGLLIYSNVDTLRSNAVIYWGFNPGQDPDVQHETNWKIQDALDYFPTQSESLIDVQRWPNTNGGIVVYENGTRRYKVEYKTGMAPYQRGVRHLLETIQHPDALVTNYIFVQSRCMESLAETDELVARCWRVHELIFQITQPQVLITTAGVVASMRRHRLVSLVLEEVCPVPSGYANWRCKVWKGQRFVVIETPHMSYWGNSIHTKGEEAVRWVSEKIRERLQVPRPQAR